MRTQSLLLSLIIFPLSSPAIENLSWTCEQALVLGGPVAPPNGPHQEPIKLAEDEILIRGKLERHWKNDSSEQTHFGIMDEFLSRKILPSKSLSFYPLRSGDHLMVYGPSGKVRIHGYYGEVGGKHALYADVKFENEVIGQQELDGYFHGHFVAAMIRKMDSESKNKLKAVLTPYISKYHEHMMNPDRFVTLNDHLTLELGYFEKLMHGSFTFKEAGPHHVEPIQVSDESHQLEQLEPHDEIFILDGHRNIIHRQKFDGRIAMIEAQDTTALLERLRTGKEIYILRQTMY